MRGVFVLAVLGLGCSSPSRMHVDPVDEDDAGSSLEDASEPMSAPDGGPPMMVSDAGAPPACPTGMVYVPAGEFIFGHFGEVRTLPAFCIDRMEVSAGEFNACVAAGGCTGYEAWEMCRTRTDSSPNQCRPGRENYPANWIDWFRATAYCEWAGKRLPTPEEWEKAARGPDGRVFPWGNTASCADAQYGRGSIYNECVGFGDLSDGIVPIDSYASVGSPYGTINQAGNVKEWVDFRADRTMPPVETYGLSKGGTFRTGSDQMMAATGDSLLGPGVVEEGHGFRCVAEPLQ